MSRRPAAINAAVSPVVNYGVDPNGQALAFALAVHGAAQLNNTAAVIPVKGPQWMGWTKPIQTMTGAAAAVAAGRARAISPTSSTLSAETSTTDETTAAIFRSRMTRGLR